LIAAAGAAYIVNPASSRCDLDGQQDSPLLHLKQPFPLAAAALHRYSANTPCSWRWHTAGVWDMARPCLFLVLLTMAWLAMKQYADSVVAMRSRTSGTAL